jgi:hypothetical protein
MLSVVDGGRPKTHHKHAMLQFPKNESEEAMQSITVLYIHK